MELRTLRYFLEIASKGSLSAAAESLHVTQPTLSRQLALLEAELGQQLYTRTHKGVSLTAEGAILQRFAGGIIQLSEEAVETVSSGSAVEGIVRIGVAESHALGLLSQAISMVRAAYPGVRFRLSNEPALTLRESLVRGHFDFLLQTEFQPIDGTESIELPCMETWCLLVPEGSVLEGKECAVVADLAHVPLIVPYAVERLTSLMAWMGANEGDECIVAHYDFPLAGKYLVDAGVGAMLTYCDLPGISLDSPRALPLEPPVRTPVALSWRTGTLGRPARIFLDMFRSLCEVERRHHSFA